MTRPKLHICVTCKTADHDLGPEDVRPGHQLYRRMKALLQSDGPEPPIDIVPVVCLANCEQGCSASISAPGKWTYLLRELNPDMAEDLVLYCERYHASANGNVFRSKRPASMRNAIGGRTPGLGQIFNPMENVE